MRSGTGLRIAGVHGLATLAACAALLFPTTAPAQMASEPAGRAQGWETRLGILFQGSADSDFEGGSSVDVDDDVGFRIGAGYHFSDNLEVGVNLDFIENDYSGTLASADPPGLTFGIDGELESTSLTADLTYNFFPGRFTPFITGALGWTWIDTNIAEGPPQGVCWWDPGSARCAPSCRTPARSMISHTT